MSIEAENLRSLAASYHALATVAAEKQLAWRECIALQRRGMKERFGNHELPAGWYRRLAELERMDGTTDEAVAMFEETADIYEREAAQLESNDPARPGESESSWD